MEGGSGTGEEAQGLLGGRALLGYMRRGL